MNINNNCIYHFFTPKHNTIKIDPYKSNFIPKIIKYDFFMENEVHITNKLTTLSNYKKHYYLFDSIDKIRICELQDDSQYIQSAHNITDVNDVLVKYENITIIKLDIYLRSLSCSRIYIYTVIESYNSLLTSINLLVSNKIVHNNIHFENIITNKCDILLTDFSKALDISRIDINEYIKNFITEYNPNYIFYPIEIQLLSYLISNKIDSISNNNVNKIIDDVLENHNILVHFGATIISKFK